MSRSTVIFLSISLAAVLVFFLGLISGPASINVFGGMNEMDAEVFWRIRVPLYSTAAIAGGSLAIAGLLMQAYFQNPLAGPYILGIHSGSTLLIALWTIGLPFLPPMSLAFLKLSEVGLSIVGSLATIMLLILASRVFSSRLLLIIFGLVLGYFSSSLVGILIALGKSSDVKTFLLWGFGSFRNTSNQDVLIMLIFVLPILTLSIFMAKSLNALSQGEDFAKASGLNIKKFQTLIIVVCGVLAGLVTAYCGPVAFIGILGPHLCRLFLRTSNHTILIPGSIVTGAFLALFAEFLNGQLSIIGGLPLNSILGFLGAPLIFYFLLQRNVRGMN